MADVITIDIISLLIRTVRRCQPDQDQPQPPSIVSPRQRQSPATRGRQEGRPGSPLTRYFYPSESCGVSTCTRNEDWVNNVPDAVGPADTRPTIIRP